MKILFATEYFYPYIHGGGEISTQLLAKALCFRGEEVHVLTPNYGTVPFEDFGGIKIHRYSFLKKLKNFSDQLSPSWYINPVFVFILFVQIVKIVLAEKIQIIHVHGLFSLPSAVLAGKILQIPVVVTFRDAQLLCNYGFCLAKNQYGHTCDLKNYFLEDFPSYWQDKVKNKGLFTLVLQLVYAIIGRIRTKVLQFFAKLADVLIVSSTSQQKTFAVNKFKAKVIHNIYPFSGKIPLSFPKGKTLLYATKMSSGKGLDVLLTAFEKVLKKVPDITLLVVGSGDKQRYEKLSQTLGIDEKTQFLLRKSPEEIMKIRQRVLLEVTPSVYPESFGRTALESLASGVPVVASNRGGLTDIVENGKTGYIANPTADELSKAIIKGIKNNQNLRRNIRKEYPALEYKFSQKPLEDHFRLYASILK